MTEKEMTKREIEQIIKKITADQLGIEVDGISRETNFFEDLNADSLDIVELIMEFEDEFELSISEEEAEKMPTIGQAVDYIANRCGKNKREVGN